MDPVEGNWLPAFPVLIEFLSLEKAHRWYNSDGYPEVKELPLAATKGHAVFMAGTAISAITPQSPSGGQLPHSD